MPCIILVLKCNFNNFNYIIIILSFTVQQEPRVIQLLSSPYFGNLVLSAGPAQFGQDLKLGGVSDDSFDYLST